MISIIIPTLHEGPFLERTLKNFDSLELPHEIIITDGGSTDETLSVARRYTEKVVVWDKPHRQTFGEAKNAGAEIATGEFLVFIDADVLIPEPEKFFQEMLAVFRKNKNLVAATVPLKPWPENHSLIDSFFCTPLNIFYIISNNWFHLGNASGEFQMIRTDAFKKISGYGEKLVAGEDNEIFRSLATIGRTISYTPLWVGHSLRRPHKLGWLRTYGIWIRNGVSITLRHKAAYKEWKPIR